MFDSPFLHKTLGHQPIRDFQCSASDSWVHEAGVAITFRGRRKIKGKPDYAIVLMAGDDPKTRSSQT